MAISNTAIVTTTETPVFTGSSTSTAVLSIIFCNTTASSLVMTAYAYPSGGSAGDSTTIIKNLTIPKEDTYVWTAEEKFILGAGDKITASLSTAASPGIAATVNYYVIS